MTFDLNNARSTYQRLVNQIFSRHLDKTMEVCINDMLIKLSKVDNHVAQLQECFNILNMFGMNLNPTKCSFVVTSESADNRRWK